MYFNGKQHFVSFSLIVDLKCFWSICPNLSWNFKKEEVEFCLYCKANSKNMDDFQHWRDELRSEDEWQSCLSFI